MTGYIYIHTNKINGKKYIGQTIQKPNRRFRKDGKGYEYCPKFWNAIKKYGWDNFEHEVIPAFEEELDFLEKEFIKKYDTIKNGYNTEDGGNKNKHLSEQTRKKLGIAHKGLPKKGGYTWTKNNTYKAYGNGFHNHKILCIELNKEFKSIKEAGKELNIPFSNISAACRGKQKTSSGYHWRYVE